MLAIILLSIGAIETLSRKFSICYRQVCLTKLDNKNDVMMMLFALKTTLRALRNIYAMFTTEKKQIIYL